MKKQAVSTRTGGFMQTRKGTRPLHVETLLRRKTPESASNVFEPMPAPERSFEQSLATTAGEEFQPEQQKEAELRRDTVGDKPTPVDPKLVESVKQKSLGEMDGHKVFQVDGGKIRDKIDTDFALGGNSARYSYVPKGELWVEETGGKIDKDEIETAKHEDREEKRMQKGETYNQAHSAATKIEKQERSKQASAISELAGKAAMFSDDAILLALRAYNKKKREQENLAPKKVVKKSSLITDLEKDSAEFAPGIPVGRVIKKIPSVKEKGPNAEWTASLSLHPAAKRGDHFDLRLVDPKGQAHSWAIQKMPEPGGSTYAAQQATHTGAYAKRTEPFSIPINVYGGTRPGAQVEPKYVQPVEVISANDNRVHFLRHQGQETEELVLRRVAKAGDRTPIWALHNATRNRASKEGQRLPDSKPKYQDIPLQSVDLNNDQQLMTAKIDGAHTLVDFPKADRMVRTYSYRPTQRQSGLIEHTFKFPNFQNLKTPSSLVGTLVRAETWATDSSGKAIPASELGGILNSNVNKARQAQQDGVTLRRTGIDVVRYKGRDISSAPFAEKMEVLREVNKATNGAIELPIAARTPEEKAKLLDSVKAGKLPETKEGVVLHDLTSSVMMKAKVRPDTDVYVREISPPLTENKGGASGFRYSFEPTGPVIGSVGTGFSQQLRRDMLKNPEKFVGRVAKVQSAGQHVSRGGRLGALIGSPAFKEWHIDKTPPELMKEGASKEKKKITAKDVGLAGLTGTGALVVASPHTKGKLLGYKRVYHGTSPENKQKILEEGLKASHGGKGGAGAAVESEYFKTRSAGKVHVTGIKPVAHQFSSITADRIGKEIEDLYNAYDTGKISEIELNKGMKKLRNKAIKISLLGHKGTVTADMPYTQFHKFEADPDLRPFSSEWLSKRVAARGGEDIAPEYVHNLNPGRYLKRLGKHLRGLPEYVAHHPGRFATGAGMAALGTGGAVYGGGKLLKKFYPQLLKKESSDLTQIPEEVFQAAQQEADPERIAERLSQTRYGRLAKPVLEEKKARRLMSKIRSRYHRFLKEN